MALIRDEGLTLEQQIEFVRSDSASELHALVMSGASRIVHGQADLSPSLIRENVLLGCTIDEEGRVVLPPKWDPLKPLV